MFKLIFMIVLLGHVIGDFYCQTDNMAKWKDRCFKGVVVHSLLYLAVMLAVMVLLFDCRLFVIGAIAAGLHFIVDSAKFFYLKSHRNSKKVFVTDQLIHLLGLIFLSICEVVEIKRFELIWPIEVFETITGIAAERIISWALAVIIIHKPTNIAIQRITKEYRPKEIRKKKTINGVGRNIGTIERLIMLIFVSLQQYMAIGLVLTAKSIARYDKISKDQVFAEYYLLGTLLSTFSVVVTAIIFL